MKRFEIATPSGRPNEADSWRVSLKQIAVLAVVGIMILAAIVVTERGNIFGGSNGASAIALVGAASGPAPKVGEVVPDFTLTALHPDPVTGDTIQLSRLAGGPVLVNFWATWCPPCRAEMPDLDEVARQYSSTGLRVVAVNLQEEPTLVANYLGTIGVNVPVALDSSGAIFRQYRIVGLPTTVAVGRDGIVREIHVGPLSKNAIHALIAKIS